MRQRDEPEIHRRPLLSPYLYLSLDFRSCGIHTVMKSKIRTFISRATIEDHEMPNAQVRLNDKCNPKIEQRIIGAFSAAGSSECNHSQGEVLATYLGITSVVSLISYRTKF